jgi:hypothetical protein
MASVSQLGYLGLNVSDLDEWEQLGLSAPLLNSSSGPLVTYAAFSRSSTVPARSSFAS